jgi:hypothetical protein
VYIEKLWYCDGYVATGRQERVLPDGRFQLVIDLASLPRPTPTVVGVRSQYAVVAVASMQSVIGVLFRPGGTHGFFDAPADGFRDRLVRLEDVWGPMAGELADRLAAADTPGEKFSILERTLRQRLNRCRALHPAVRFLLNESRHNASSVKVGSLSDRIGLSREFPFLQDRARNGVRR